MSNAALSVLPKRDPLRTLELGFGMAAPFGANIDAGVMHTPGQTAGRPTSR